MEDQEKILQEYSFLKQEEKLVKEKIELLYPSVIEITSALIGEDKGQIETGNGKFSLTQLRTYTYPEYVKEAEAKFKQLKTDAEAKGDATYVEKPSVKFTPNK